MSKMKAELITLKILVKKGKDKHFSWSHFARLAPGYLDHKYENVEKKVEVNDMRGLEINWEDWFI